MAAAGGAQRVRDCAAGRDPANSRGVGLNTLIHVKPQVAICSHWQGRHLSADRSTLNEESG